MESLEKARLLDSQDVLKQYATEFYKNENHYYFDGNSLGLLSKRAENSLLTLLNSWKQFGIDGWTNGEHPWYFLSENLGAKCAPLVGAKKEEVILTGSTTTNLHQLLATFFHPNAERNKILADELNFPSDLYAISSQIHIRNLSADHLRFVKSEDGQTITTEAIIEAMTDDVAVAILPAVLYRSGQVLDIATITKAAHERGIVVGFDLCHSIGSIPHQLHDMGVDFAFWCNYKHLNSGPGSVAGLFVHEKHFGSMPGLAGWFGSDKTKQFDLAVQFSPANAAGAYQIGTPHILSLAPIEGSLSIFEEVGIEAIRKKSLQLTGFIMDCLQQELPNVFQLGNPTDETRGGHVFLVHEEAARICKALKEAGVVPDFRAPNGIRLAPVALYNSFEEVWKVVQILKDIMTNETYKKFQNEREIIA
ncbi:kynureninase [Solibacillus sp. R5-41]|uniref:kynureninase n=1 Tax=Solibacillus sp. R5-41 TaxID=2048654 RepID=UPI000C1258D8|nr:kynureninase [Solibacillus sp. R5-41]ATP39709.1 kynureninase [Solibacillus sp. R5-41]